MKRNKGRWLALLASVVMAMSMTACGKAEEKTTAAGAENATTQESTTETTTETTDAESAEVVEEEVVDLGGIEIVIGDWWSPEEPAAPTNAKEEAILEYRNMIQEKYNFTMKQVAVSDWGGMQELFTTSVMAEDPAADIFILAPDWTAQPLANGLLYDLATLSNVDFTSDKWNASVRNALTFGESTYGMAVGMPEPKLGVYFNKRLLEEAGIDPELPYDLQASGEWTWEKFDELCQQLTIDNNNDGVIDSYAMASFSVDFIRGAVTSNGASFIGKDEQGSFTNATSDPNFLEALQWVVSGIEKGYEMPMPAEANWDWFISAFHDAKVAMTFGEQYKTGTWADMTDDWGFVLCPKGPKATNYNVYFGDNVAVIPSSYDQELASKIAFAYDLWTNPAPGFEDEGDGWKDSYYTKFRDERAVDETLAMMYNTADVKTEYLHFVYGTSFGDFAWDVYGLTATPAEKIEAVAGTWKALIEDANK